MFKFNLTQVRIVRYNRMLSHCRFEVPETIRPHEGGGPLFESNASTRQRIKQSAMWLLHYKLRNESYGLEIDVVPVDISPTMSLLL